VEALKANNNLDLEGYNPLVREFKDLSSNLFHSDNIFKDQHKMLDVNKTLRMKTVRMTQANHLGKLAGKSLSPERVSSLEKTMPPDYHE